MERITKVFGDSTVEVSVSCSKLQKQGKHLGYSGGADYFERLASNMMFSQNEHDYEQSVTEMENFIEEKPERRSHFAKAFKNPSAPSRNLSET